MRCSIKAWFKLTQKENLMLMKTNIVDRFNLNGICAQAAWALALCALFFVYDATAGKPSGGSAADLDGRWYHDGKPTRILVAPDGRSVTIVNELGQSSDGYAADPRNLAIPSLGITGRVSKDGQRISWTNGTEWRRDSSMPGPIPTVDISGRWFRNGQPTRIEVGADGRNFTITNEWGLPGTGYINRNGELKVTSWRVTGQLSNNGQRISWSNGTVWTRPRLY
jgi:hypothetical protein